MLFANPMDNIFFKNRIEAGQRLAEKLMKYKDENPVVLALPRGGVVLGKEIAKALDCPLDLVITRKIGHPMSPEYAIGAITVGGETILNEEETSRVDQEWLRNEKETQQEEAKRRQKAYLENRKPIELKNKTAIIVDDGIATGLTMRAAIKEVQMKNPAKTVVAVPVTPIDAYEKISKDVDEFVALSVPDYFLGAIGSYYEDFRQVGDDEVIAIMQKF